MKEEYFNDFNIDNVSRTMMEETIAAVGRIKNSQIDFSRSALLVLDMQDYFLDEKSNAFIPSAPVIINNINRLITAFNSFDRPIVCTRHINSNQDAGMMGKWWMRLIEVDDSLSKINDDLNIPDQCKMITKHQYDAFFETDLDEYLQKSNVNTLIICGVMTNLCVETTARSAFVRSYRTIIPIDATATYNYDYHLSSCKNLAFGFSTLCRSKDIISGTLDNE